MSSIVFSVSLGSVKGASSLKGEGRGVVEKTGKDGSAVIRLSNGTKITVDLADNSELKNGDHVAVTKKNGYIVIEKVQSDPAQLKNELDSVNIKNNRSFEEILTAVSKALSSVNVKDLSPADMENLKKVISIISEYENRLPQDIKRALNVLTEIIDKYGQGKQPLNSELKNIVNQNIKKLEGFLLTVRQNISGTKPMHEVKTDIREGYYFFRSRKDAEVWLKNNTDFQAVNRKSGGLFKGRAVPEQFTVSQKENNLSDHINRKSMNPGGEKHTGADRLSAGLKKNLFIHVNVDSNNIKRASIHSETGIKSEIKYFMQENISSNILRKIPADVITKQILEKQTFDINDIKRIDRLFTLFEKQSGRILPKNNMELLSGEALKNSFVQIAGLVSEKGAQMPVNLAASVYKTVENLLPRIEEMFTLGRDDLDKITEGLYMTGKPASEGQNSAMEKNVVLQIIQKLGITYESDILNSRNSFVKRPAADSIKLFLLNVMETIDKAVENGEKSLSDKIKPEEIAEIVQKALKTMNKKVEIGQPLRNQEMISLHKFREQVEGVIKNLESVQLMARNSTSRQGEHQMFIIPVMIDGEWKETRIRFTKRRRSEKSGRDSGHFTVNLNIEPGKLGKINVNMDHFSGRNTSIDMRFERPAVGRWFTRRKKSICGSLESSGLRSVTLNIGAIRDETDMDSYGTEIKNRKTTNIEIWG